MNRQRADAALDLALQSVVTALVSHLRDSSVPRKQVEAALKAAASSSVDSARLRMALGTAFEQARIRVIDDAAELDHWSDNVDAASLAPQVAAVDNKSPVDPLTAARRRLERDRLLSPERWAKEILTAEEEVGLTLIARPGGAPLEQGGLAGLTGEPRTAADAMILHNMGLAHSVCRGYLQHGMEYDDLIQSAMPGLFRAVELFDPSSGNKFSTYATHWLRQAVTRAIANEARVIRLPVHMWELVRKVVMTRARLSADGRAPSRHALAEACEITLEKLEQVLALAPGAVSLDSPLGDDGFTLGDLVDAQADEVEHVEVHGLFPDDVERLLGHLTEREADVLRRRHGLAPHDEISTLDDIGKIHGVTRERIRQIESKALARLWNRLKFEGVVVTSDVA